jgi:starch phosphorylase
MKASMKMAMDKFCSLRMVGEYEERFYFPAAKRLETLVKNKAREAKQIATQIKRFRSLWKQIQISPPIRQNTGIFRVGDSLEVTSEVTLGELTPDEVDVELYYGHMKTLDALEVSNVEPMTVREDRGNGQYLYDCAISCELSGRFGCTVRATPHGDERIKSTPGLLTWA